MISVDSDTVEQLVVLLTVICWISCSENIGLLSELSTFVRAGLLSETRSTYLNKLSYQIHLGARIFIIFTSVNNSSDFRQPRNFQMVGIEKDRRELNPLCHPLAMFFERVNRNCIELC